MTSRNKGRLYVGDMNDDGHGTQSTHFATRGIRLLLLGARLWRPGTRSNLPTRRLRQCPQSDLTSAAGWGPAIRIRKRGLENPEGHGRVRPVATDPVLGRGRTLTASVPACTIPTCIFFSTGLEFAGGRSMHSSPTCSVSATRTSVKAPGTDRSLLCCGVGARGPIGASRAVKQCHSERLPPLALALEQRSGPRPKPWQRRQVGG